MTEKGLDFETINYLENPISEKELKKLLDTAGLKPIDAIRTNEAPYRKQVAGKDLSEEQLIRVMVKTLSSFRGRSSFGGTKLFWQDQQTNSPNSGSSEAVFRLPVVDASWPELP